MDELKKGKLAAKTFPGAVFWCGFLLRWTVGGAVWMQRRSSQPSALEWLGPDYDESQKKKNWKKQSEMSGTASLGHCQKQANCPDAQLSLLTWAWTAPTSIQSSFGWLQLVAGLIQLHIYSFSYMSLSQEKKGIAGPVAGLGGTASQRTIDSYTPVIHHSFI